MDSEPYICLPASVSTSTLRKRERRGCCAQFRALSDQLYGTGSHYADLRRLAVEQLAACPQWCAL